MKLTVTEFKEPSVSSTTTQVVKKGEKKREAEQAAKPSKALKPVKANKPKAAKKEKGKGKARTGRFTYFPDKTITRSWRITAKTDDLLRAAGERVKDKDKGDSETGKAGRAVGATDVIEALARLYAPTLKMEDIVKAMGKQ